MVKKRSRRKCIGKRKKKQRKVMEASTATSAVQTEDAQSSSPATNTRASTNRRQANQPSEQPQVRVVTIPGEDGGPGEVIEMETIVLGDIPPEGMVSDESMKEIKSNVANRIKSKTRYRNHAIAYFFIEKHGIPPRDTWKGKNGIASQIKESLCIESGTDILAEMEEIMSCLEQGIKYDP